MIRLLRYVNSMPFRLTIRHLFPLGAADRRFEGLELTAPEAWDAVRRSHPHFVTPDTREAWIAAFQLARDGQDEQLVPRAAQIAALIERKRFRSVHSLGVGSGALEYALSRQLQNVTFAVSEFNTESVRRLRLVFPEAHPVHFDIRYSPWSADTGADHLVLIYRLDPHLSDAEWRAAFKRMYEAGVRNVLYVPSRFLTVWNLCRAWQLTFQSRLSGRPLSFAGYRRTRTVFHTFWGGLYEQDVVTLARLEGYLLTRRANADHGLSRDW